MLGVATILGGCWNWAGPGVIERGGGICEIVSSCFWEAFPAFVQKRLFQHPASVGSGISSNFMTQVISEQEDRTQGPFRLRFFQFF